MNNKHKRIEPNKQQIKQRLLLLIINDFTFGNSDHLVQVSLEPVGALRCNLNKISSN